jgi:enediyne biosynthesis protein E5
MRFTQDIAGGKRVAALRRFAAAITLLNILGHSWFGFEQSWATPVVAIAAAYLTELVLEYADAGWNGRRPAFARGGVIQAIDFFLPAHITGLACAMLLYAGSSLAAVVFAVVTGISSKALFRIRTSHGSRHFFNPSNFGITATLLLFPWVGIAPPYHFTENIRGAGDIILPAIIVLSGSFLNYRFTGRIPLILSWLAAFSAAAGVRTYLTGLPLWPALLPATGVAFILYTFYMVSDPATTPMTPARQAMFGASVGVVYQLLVAAHVVFGLFFALSIVSAARGVGIWIFALARANANESRPVKLLTAVARAK